MLMYNFPSSISSNLFNGFTESSKTNRIERAARLHYFIPPITAKPFFPPYSVWKPQKWENLRPIFHNVHTKITE